MRDFNQWIKDAIWVNDRFTESRHDKLDIQSYVSCSSDQEIVTHSLEIFKPERSDKARYIIYRRSAT